MSTNQTIINKDLANKQIVVTRAFAAPLRQVWNAWTQAELLDQWWAPKPYKAVTKSLDFRDGGLWFYAMKGPDGDLSWVRVDIETVEPLKSFTATDSFCDENGNITNVLPSMHWHCVFAEADRLTTVTTTLTFATEEDLHKILELGFSEGFTAAHGNLDEVLAGN